MTDTIEEIRRGRLVFLLADPKFDVRELYARLLATSLPVKIALLENLGYPEERIVMGSIQSPPRPSVALYSLLIGNF
jgi:cobalt-precorrin-7 (C5)-methyltransferase